MITTIVLGAGASKQYGFPTGPELLELVKDRFSGSNIGHDAEIYRGLSHIGIGSLDAYINHDPNAGPLIKQAIAEIIFSCEDEGAFDRAHGDCLYAKLFASIPPEKYGQFRIVSFNYDRSLEFYFLRGIMALKKCSEVEALRILSALKIVHVHNRLPDLPHEDGFSIVGAYYKLAYGEYREKSAHLKSLQGESPWFFSEWHMPVERYSRDKLKTCFENTAVCTAAAQAIKESERVVFLGFGFHETNMKTLGYSFDYNAPSPKRVTGTAWRLSGNEKRRVEKNYPEITLAEDCTCTGLLENHVCLENPDLDALAEVVPEMPSSMRIEALTRI